MATPMLKKYVIQLLQQKGSGRSFEALIKDKKGDHVFLFEIILMTGKRLLKTDTLHQLLTRTSV